MKKKWFLKGTLLLGLVAVFTSCNRDENADTLCECREEVKFSSNIITMNTPQTRAAGNTWHSSDAIGVYMYEENSLNVVEDKKNIEYYTEAGGENGDFKARSTVIYFPDDGSEVRFMAYYPYKSEVIANDNVYKVNVANQSSQKDIDLLYSFNTDAKYDKTVLNKKVLLVFDHQLTKIYVNVKAGIGLTNDDLQNIGISFAGFNTLADFNLENGGLSNPTVPAVITPYSLTAITDYAASFEAIVLPTAGIPDAKIVFNLNNGNEGTGKESDIFTWDFNNVLDKSTKYTYNVIVNRSGIVVEATINDWTSTDENEVIAE